MPDISESVDSLSIVRETALHQTILFDPDASAPIYIGWAPPGTASAIAKWKIARLTYGTGNVTRVEWADGNILYDNIYDNRASLSYS